jgi:hypothetical protein
MISQDIEFEEDEEEQMMITEVTEEEKPHLIED